MPQTKTFGTDAYRRVPYKSAFELDHPAVEYMGQSRALADPSKEMARAKRIPEMKNPAPEKETPIFRRDDMGHPLPPAGGSFSPTPRPGKRV
jgi:hypothetical protein